MAAGMDPDRVIRHTLRHTAITQLVQSGIDLPTVKRISGHKTLAMVQRYAHANGEHIQIALDMLDARYSKITSAREPSIGYSPNCDRPGRGISRKLHVRHHSETAQAS
jgi:hypothetical protein